MSVEVPGETEVDTFELLFLLPVLSLISCLESVFTVVVVASILGFCHFIALVLWPWLYGPMALILVSRTL